MAQAEAEYKDFILFYPTMEEAAESQEKICKIHYEQMDKADRDPNNALRAEQECRQLITQFPNSKYVPEAQQRLREIQEVLAEAEFVAGAFYHKRGSNAAAANRFDGLVFNIRCTAAPTRRCGKKPIPTGAWVPASGQREGEACTKLVREYPLEPAAPTPPRSASRCSKCRFPKPIRPPWRG